VKDKTEGTISHKIGDAEFTIYVTSL